MKISYLYLLAFLIILNGCVTTGKSPSKEVAVKHTGSGTLVIKQIGFSQESNVREAVRNECNLDGKLAGFIEKNAADQYSHILNNSNSTTPDAQVLTIEIEQVQGGAGGAWSGGKMVLINGKLTQNGKELGNFKGKRFSGGGVFAGYKGTCSILGRCVKTLGKDVAQWLAQPTPNARLGDL